MAYNYKTCVCSSEIFNTDIYYCTIPRCDRGGRDCKDCELLEMDALSALGSEIVKLQKLVAKHEEVNHG